MTEVSGTPRGEQNSADGTGSAWPSSALSSAEWLSVMQALWAGPGVAVAVLDTDDVVVVANSTFTELVGEPGVALCEGKSGLRRSNDEGHADQSGAAFVAFERADGSRVVASAWAMDLGPAGGDRCVLLMGASSVRRVDQAPDLLGKDQPFGLVAREAFAAIVRGELADQTGRRAGVLLIELDRFETISDALGRTDSDRLFTAMVERLRSVLAADDVVCRFGSDEIAVLTPARSNAEDIAATLEATVDAIHEPFLIDRQPVSTRVSIGATVSSPSSTVESMLREADVALSQAKTDGLDFAVFDETLQARLDERSRFEGELRLALSGGRLELFYQPVVNMASGQLLGVEALVRWPHPVHGLLPADRFVAVAEHAGIVSELGRWVLREACSALAAWDAGSEMVMRVNVSAAQLATGDLVAEVRAVLEDMRIRPDRLCLEITETSVMVDVERSTSILRRLAGLGVQLAIDDFGTGFSSLAYLKNLPVDILKLDGALVADVATDGAARSILAAVLMLGESLGLEVVAEGVENEAQRDALLELGCSRGQGHLFSNPMDDASTAAWLRA